jgi:PilZ domain
MGEHRAIRVPIDLPAWLQIETRSIPCRITNISLGGVFVTGAMLVPDTPLSIRFTPPRYGELLAACTARWSCAAGVGLRFERLAAGVADQLAWVIRDVLARMA